jgi:hypothetical protein
MLGLISKRKVRQQFAEQFGVRSFDDKPAYSENQRLVSLMSLVILLAVAPVAVGQSVQGPQPTGATPTYGLGSDNEPIAKQHPNPATNPIQDPPLRREGI